MSIKINEQHDTWDIIGREIQGKHPKYLFGYQVSLSEGEKRLGIGAPQDPEMGENSGAVSVYELQSGSYYTQLGESLHGNGKMCLFGSLMSILKNGVNVAIGGNLGFIYRYDNGEWVEYPLKLETLLEKVAIVLSMDGSKAVVVSQPGVAFIYSLA